MTGVNIDKTAEAMALAHSLVDGLPDPAVLLDSELNAVHFNAAYAELSGRRIRWLDKLLSGVVSVFDVIAQSAESDRDNAERCVRSGKALHLAEVPIRNTSGDEFVVLQSFVPVVGVDGDCVAVIESFRDVSGEVRIHQRYKELVARVRQRSDDLERQVQRRTEQLTAALEEVTRLSRIDPLTGVLNRRAFTEHAEQALRLAFRHQRCGAILMCDLDHFKKLNDGYGHQAGDAVLVAVAAALESIIRTTDKVARFGGEEFVVLLAETDSDGVLTLAERCREVVQALPLAEMLQRPASMMRQTISVGAAVFPEQGDTLDRLIARADEALYQAKRTGRDRVVMYDERLREALESRSISTEGEKWRNPIILIVDPDRLRAARTRGALSDQWRALYATTQDDALLACSRHSVDVVVVDDVVRPDGGIDLLRRILAMSPASLRILVIESESVFLTIRGTNAARVDHFILRRDVSEYLMGAIRDGLLRRELAREHLTGDLATDETNWTQCLEAANQLIAAQSYHFAYQPIVRAVDGGVVGHEALCRPVNPLFRNPEILFDLAARVGSLWTLSRLVRQSIVADLPKLDPSSLVFINLHPSEIADPLLLDGDPCLLPWARRIVFEITERTAIPDLDRFKNEIATLRGHGFRVAIDDLGAGYASLNLVALLEPEFVKIDKSMIWGIEASTTKQNIVRSIAHFCRSQGISFIAEGIEDPCSAQIATELGCDLLQGYLFGKPESLDRRLRSSAAADDQKRAMPLAITTGRSG